MMDAAMDRWGVNSSFVYQKHLNNSNKENDSKTSNAKDSKKKQRKPLSRKQDQEQLPKSLDAKPSKKSNRQSGLVARMLGGDERLPPPLDDSDSIDPPPPFDNVLQSPHAEEEMNEVSTIANDTFVGVEMDAAVAEAVPPYSPYDSAYDLPMPVPPGAHESMDDAMITPTYSVLRNNKKRVSRVFHDVDLDEKSTFPESPDSKDDYDNVEDGDNEKSTNKSFFSRKSQKGNKSFYSADDDKDGDNKSSLPRFGKSEKKPVSQKRRRFRCMMCSACVLGTFLLLGIAALGYTLYAVRNEDKGAPHLFTREFWTKYAFWNKDKEGEPQETDEEFSGTWSPTYSGSHSNTWSGTSSPTFSGTESGTITAEMERIRSIVKSATLKNVIPGMNLAAFNDRSSIQFYVLEWLSLDPSLELYSEEKILQRYALGCFYVSVLGQEEGDVNSKNYDIVRDTWMSGGDECTEWINTETKKDQKPPCDENGMIRSIHLENAGLTGTLSPELALLADSLGTLNYFVFKTIFSVSSCSSRCRLLTPYFLDSFNGSNRIHLLDEKQDPRNHSRRLRSADKLEASAAVEELPRGCHQWPRAPPST